MKGVNREEVGRNCKQKEILISVDFRQRWSTTHRAARASIEQMSSLDAEPLRTESMRDCRCRKGKVSWLSMEQVVSFIRFHV